MKSLKSRITFFILATLVWFLLTYPFDMQEMIAGVALALFLMFFRLPGMAVLGELQWTPKSLIYSIGYVFYFLWQLLKANLDVAFRVLHPGLPIEPGIVRITTTLKTPLGRLILANSITLTPGTITVDTAGDVFYIHWIKVRGVHDKERTRAIAAGFEKFLEVICG